jgi:hypothetical protein
LSSGTDIPAHITFSPIHTLLQGTDAVSIVAALYLIRHGIIPTRLRGLGKPPRDKYISSSDCSAVCSMLYIDHVFHRHTRILAFSNSFCHVRIVPTSPTLVRKNIALDTRSRWTLQVSVDRICGKVLGQAGTDWLLGYLHDRGQKQDYILVCYLSLIRRGHDVRLRARGFMRHIGRWTHASIKRPSIVRPEAVGERW